MEKTHKLALFIPLFTFTAACEAPLTLEEIAAAEERLTTTVAQDPPEEPVDCPCPVCAPIWCQGVPLIHACHSAPPAGNECTEHFVDCDGDGHNEWVWRCHTEPCAP